MGFSRYINMSLHLDNLRVTPSRQHVTSHALGPGLLHSAEEATHYHGPEQADTINAYVPDLSFSGITRAFVGVLQASWFQRRLYSRALLLLYSDT
jgi:hypothetical protein